MNTLIATRCAICSRKLTDELSIEMGIGPDCRKGHGYEARDAESDWGAALFALGASCDNEAYEGVVAAFGILSMRGVLPMPGFNADAFTSFKDAKKAVRVLTHRLATAMERNLTKEDVVRTVAAIRELGYVKLARALSLGLKKRRDYREHFEIKVADVTTITHGDGSKKYRLDASYSTMLISRLRSLPWAVKSFDRLTKTWTLSISANELNDMIWASGFDVVSGVKMVPVEGSTTGETKERHGVSVRAEMVKDADSTKREWWTDACDENDRVWWVDRETGEAVRVVIPGEPAWRPGVEKVPADFFARSLAGTKSNVISLGASPYVGRRVAEA